MEKEHISTGQEKKVEELHWEIQRWKSNFQFMDDELLFIGRLMDSYIFEPNTPNLFERLQNYKTRIKKIDTSKKKVRDEISKHENTLGGMLECTDSACDLTYYRKHDKLQSQVDACFEDFRKLKSEIFNYAGGILKRRKP
ncbi:hypothetical protein [Maribacter aestuarii]|uniref:hypothetical protein n=1 Tax=Maribacter aestuarii TaxID=1130723 RepID=UPI00248C666C|nr:hypothetical protein [Maribacter aestuarii]